MFSFAMRATWGSPPSRTSTSRTSVGETHHSASGELVVGERHKPIGRARRPHIEQVAVIALRQVDAGQNHRGRLEALELVDAPPPNVRRVFDTRAEA